MVSDALKLTPRLLKVATPVVVALPSILKFPAIVEEAVIYSPTEVVGEITNELNPEVNLQLETALPGVVSSALQPQAEPVHFKIWLVEQEPKATVVEAFNLVSKAEVKPAPVKAV